MVNSATAFRSMVGFVQFIHSIFAALDASASASASASAFACLRRRRRCHLRPPPPAVLPHSSPGGSGSWSFALHYYRPGLPVRLRTAGAPPARPPFAWQPVARLLQLAILAHLSDHVHRPSLPLRAAGAPPALLPLAWQPVPRPLHLAALTHRAVHVHRPGLPLRAAGAPPAPLPEGPELPPRARPSLLPPIRLYNCILLL